ncbi:MAG: diguanylate cyclase [Ectothiorhodospiraceae bacterium]|nr:diguanylate cyclase [Ectothiorhodospiraceae bacterium]
MIDSWRFAGADRSADTTGEASTGVSAFSTLELRALLRTTSESVLVVDDTGLVVKAAASEATQWVANALLGKRLDEALDETSSRAFYEALLVSRRYQRTETVTFTLSRDGQQHSFVATAYPLEQGAVLCSVRDITRQHAVDTALATRFEIERLLGRCSYRFINIHPDRIDLAIDQTLGDLGIYCGVDRAYIYQQAEQTLTNSHGWRRSGLSSEQPAHGQRLHAGQLPWLARQLYSQELVTVDSLDQLPQEALLERTRLQQAGVSSLVVVPIIYSGDVRGFLGVDRGPGHDRWTREQLHLLRSAGEIFASALQRKQSERRIFRLAYYDRLTGLPNRQLLRRRVGQLCQSMNQPFALLLLDLNDAGMLNYLLGHDVGDLLLKTVSARLEACLPHGHPLARWGGDEFIFTIPLNAGDIDEQVHRQVDRLRDLRGKPVRVAGHELRVAA